MGFPHTFINDPRCIRARKNKKKKQNEPNSRALQKWPKRQKRENNIKYPKKRGKKKKKAGQQAKYHDILPQDPKQQKNQTERANNCAERGTLALENSAQQNSAKLE